MAFKANINFDRFEAALQVVDAHTVGEFCRMVIGGFPEPEGNTMIEKKKWMEENYDHVRTALMFEPRGHHDMFGAFICAPINKEADFGVLFMDTGGYLNMCGHCTIGAVTVAIEAGLVESHEGENEVVLDAPAGIVRTKAMVKDGGDLHGAEGIAFFADEGIAREQLTLGEKPFLRSVSLCESVNFGVLRQRNPFPVYCGKQCIHQRLRIRYRGEIRTQVGYAGGNRANRLGTEFFLVRSQSAGQHGEVAIIQQCAVMQHPSAGGVLCVA